MPMHFDPGFSSSIRTQLLLQYISEKKSSIIPKSRNSASHIYCMHVFVDTQEHVELVSAKK